MDHVYERDIQLALDELKKMEVRVLPIALH